MKKLEKGLIWFDGHQFQAGTLDDFESTSKKYKLRKLYGFEMVTVEEARKVTESLNNANTLLQVKIQAIDMFID